MALSLTLALKDMRHDWQSALCFVAALVGVLAPLLIILALKNGIIGTMVGRLIDDPNNRQLIAVGAGSHTPAFFDEMRARDDVAFIVPATRSINTVANALRNRNPRALERAVPLIPTGPGDPLLPDIPLTEGQAVASDTLREQLSLEIGSTVEMVIGRELDSQSQTARADLTVTGFVPPDLYGRAALFISLPDLLAVERFRDDASVTPETWRNPAPFDRYASFRIYAKSLDDLRPLQIYLEEQGVQVRPRAENATLLLLFRKNLNILYAAVAVIAALGFWAAMAANLRGMVERQRIAFSLLTLLGLPEAQRRLIPILQSTTLVILGVAATLVLVLPAIALINLGFATAPGQFIARLSMLDIAATLTLGLITALTASIWAVAAIGNIHSEEVLRHA
ncbi:ABC transporter [Litoreibacter roseus]|uniref:ABC transporter n=1 Tax=Litoreibacter roseus TaxID=2601869 RepID=A0A6N6JCM9_9RHOB|nr:ABC transporter [Litoreibacter roseus]GFE64091.1 ABC transporter [Litoreibacter roseus]